jgi:hypothetical protein
MSTIERDGPCVIEHVFGLYRFVCLDCRTRTGWMTRTEAQDAFDRHTHQETT